MRRADRLFQIVQLMRRRKVTTARELAGELEVSERTVYRDIADLIASGVPIEGEAGVGYLLRPGFDLPPLMFTAEEISALVLGMRVVSSWTDTDLARAARQALERIEAAVPERLRPHIEGTRLYAPGFHVDAATLARLGELRAAVNEQRKVYLEYVDREGNETARTIRPLGLFFWGAGWTVFGWCELRQAFRQFQLSRIQACSVLDERFVDEPGKTLEDYLALSDEEK